MRSEPTALDAAIDDAARALITPPPDEALLARTLGRLPERPREGPRLLWIPVASAAALAAWVVLGPNLAPRVEPDQSTVLIAAGRWEAMAPLASGVTAAPPSVPMSAAEPARPGLAPRVVEDHGWGLAPVDAPAPLVVDGLPNAVGVLETIDVSPLAVQALGAPAALSEMKE